MRYKQLSRRRSNAASKFWLSISNMTDRRLEPIIKHHQNGYEMYCPDLYKYHILTCNHYKEQYIALILQAIWYPNQSSKICLLNLKLSQLFLDLLKYHFSQNRFQTLNTLKKGLAQTI